MNIIISAEQQLFRSIKLPSQCGSLLRVFSFLNERNPGGQMSVSTGIESFLNPTNTLQQSSCSLDSGLAAPGSALIRLAVNTQHLAEAMRTDVQRPTDAPEAQPKAIVPSSGRSARFPPQQVCQGLSPPTGVPVARRATPHATGRGRVVGRGSQKPTSCWFSGRHHFVRFCGRDFCQ